MLHLVEKVVESMADNQQSKQIVQFIPLLPLFQ